MTKIKGSRVLVTGCSGTVGKHLVEQLVLGEYGPLEIIGIDNNESELFFNEQHYLAYDHVNFSLADVRDPGALQQIMEGVDIVLHCAGYKHVVMCERSPFDAVQTNIHGVQNIIHAATVNRVKRVLFTSTDKAVNPTNVMGTSKLMGERLITAANSRFRGEGTIYSSTRFGNVLGSRGSVIPIFMEQIRRKGPVTLTDERMTRFIMSIEESARLVLNSLDLMCGGEVFITKMPIIRIKDLAEVMIAELAPLFGHEPAKIQIKTIGAKSGEKLYEELMTGEETQRAIELERYFAIKPAFTGIYRQKCYDYPGILSDTVTRPYISEDGPFLTKTEIKDFLLKNNLLLADDEMHKPAERYWPGDKSERSM
jgi:FlaA1/EpsC-like NDP-sugar epimerase